MRSDRKLSRETNLFVIEFMPGIIILTMTSHQILFSVVCKLSVFLNLTRPVALFKEKATSPHTSAILPWPFNDWQPEHKERGSILKIGLKKSRSCGVLGCSSCSTSFWAWDNFIRWCCPPLPGMWGTVDCLGAAELAWKAPLLSCYHFYQLFHLRYLHLL